MADNSIPVWNKYNLTISEASEYFNIGENKLRQLISCNKNAEFLLYNGIKVLIKREKFEKFIDETESL